MNPCSVLTIHIGSVFNTIADMTVPFMEKYANKIGADFNVIRRVGKKHISNQYSAYWAKFQIQEILDVYDRILYVDLDTLVFSHCPDIFELVDENKIGLVFEDDYGCYHPKEIQTIQYHQGDIGWRNGYFNVGVMVLSKQHKSLFETMDADVGLCEYPEQTQINYNLQRKSLEVQKLDYTWNHMGFLKGPDINKRFQSNIFHYAATPHEFREHFIRYDIERYSRGAPPATRQEMMRLMYDKLDGRLLSDIWKYKLVKDEELY